MAEAGDVDSQTYPYLRASWRYSSLGLSNDEMWMANSIMQCSDHLVSSFSCQEICGSWWCIHGKLRIIWRLAVMVTRNEMVSEKIAPIWRWKMMWGEVQRVMVPLPVWPPSMVLILSGCCRFCMGNLSWTRSSLMKFAEAPESVRAGKIKTWMIWTLSMKDWRVRNWKGLSTVVLEDDVALSAGLGGDAAFFHSGQPATAWSELLQ